MKSFVRIYLKVLFYIFSTTTLKKMMLIPFGEVYDIDKSRDYTTLKALYGGDNEKITYDNKNSQKF